jgi:hypothetical protein
MSKPEHNSKPNRISRHRKRTEVLLGSLLYQSGHSARIDDIKTLIFEFTQDDFNLYLEYFLQMFESPKSSVDVDAAIPIIQDAWNYFPHRFLDGRCPAEVLDELAGNSKSV